MEFYTLAEVKFQSGAVKPFPRFCKTWLYTGVISVVYHYQGIKHIHEHLIHRYSLV